MNIRHLREELGLSQEQLARNLGVSFMTVSRWERGHSKPSQLAIDKLSQFKDEWGETASSEIILPEKAELVFPKRTSVSGSFARAMVDMNINDWIEKRKPGYAFDWAIIKPYGKNRFRVTKMGIKPKERSSQILINGKKARGNERTG